MPTSGCAFFSQLPIKHKNIICQPMISAIDLERYLPGVELGTHFIKDGTEYTLQKKDLCAQARKANIHYQAK